MSKIFFIDPQTGNNYQGDEQTITNVIYMTNSNFLVIQSYIFVFLLVT
jgi:hypothetical protein